MIHILLCRESEWPQTLITNLKFQPMKTIKQTTLARKNQSKGKCIRVLHIVEAASAGVGKHVADLACWQARNGIEVSVFYNINNVDQYFLDCIKSNQRVNWTPSNISRALGLRLLDAIRKIRQYAKINDIDVVHGHSSVGGALARLSCFSLGLRIIYTPNAFLGMNPSIGIVYKGVLTILERLLARATDTVITVSVEEKDYFLNTVKGGCSCVLINNGIDVNNVGDRKKIREEFCISRDDVVVGFVGRLDPQKAPFDVVQVINNVSENCENVKFFVVGDGCLKEETYSRIGSNSKLDSNTIKLTKAVGQHIMAAFDIFLLPSKYEGFPYVVIEALSNGLPVITTHEACVSSSVKHGINGYLAASGENPLLAGYVVELVNNQALRNEMSKNSLSMSHQFTVDKMCREVLSVYKQVMCR